MANGGLKYSKEQEALRPQLAQANISPDSFLATDYLNHFNEIVMTLEMAMDMPELAEDAKEWEPLSYVEHFEQSGFAAKELVIEAYKIAPVTIRESFEAVIEELNQVVTDSIVIVAIAEKGDSGFTERECKALERSQELMHHLLGELNSIIHSAGPDPDAQASDDGEAHSQDEIDQLFD